MRESSTLTAVRSIASKHALERCTVCVRPTFAYLEICLHMTATFLVEPSPHCTAESVLEASGAVRGECMHNERQSRSTRIESIVPLSITASNAPSLNGSFSTSMVCPENSSLITWCALETAVSISTGAGWRSCLPPRVLCTTQCALDFQLSVSRCSDLACSV